MLLEITGVLSFSVLFDAFGKEFYSSVVEMDVIIQVLVTYCIVVYNTPVRENSTAPEDLRVNGVGNVLGNV